MLEMLQEYIDCRDIPLKLDKDVGVIRGVKLLGENSRNGRVYPEATRMNAAKLYEGVHVNVNHMEPVHAPRKYQDRIGFIRNVESKRDGLYGELHYNPAHTLAGQLAWDAEHSPESVGLSHVVQAKSKTLNGKTIVEAITKVQSVDLVADPATTTSLFEDNQNLTEKENDMDYESITKEELATKRPDIVKMFRESDAKELADSEGVKKTAADIKTLQEKVKAYEEADKDRERADRAKTLIGEAKLPEAAVTESFTKMVALAKDEEAAKAIIAERQELIKSLGKTEVKPKSKEQRTTEQAVTSAPKDAKAFAEAISD